MAGRDAGYELDDGEESFCHLLTGLDHGQLLDGKYRIEGVLGVGGMGVVLAAFHLDLERSVAIKVLRAELAQEERIATRLLQEGRAAASIKSEHVAQVIDVGRLESGAPYVVMERLEGIGFDRLLLENGPLPLSEAVDAIVETCEALAQAHAAGIIHRDVKPGNLFLARRLDGSTIVKLLDFGISKSLHSRRRRSMALTDPHLALGSPNYMAPEQIKAADDVDARADIWALGAILFELLTGRQVFDADGLTALQAKILLEEQPNLRAMRPDVPVAVERVVRRCLMKDREARYREVEAVARELVVFGSERSVAALERSSRISAGTCRTEPSVPPGSGGYAAVVTRAAPVNVIGRIAGLASLAAALAFVVVFFGAPVIAPSASARSERILVSSCGAGFRAEAPEPSASPQVRAVPPRGVVARSEERRSENRFVAPSPTAQVEPASEQDIELTETSTHRPPWARYRRRAQVFRPDSL